MDHVFTGVMRHTKSVEVLSTPSSISLGTAGPAVIALRGTGTPGEEISVKMPAPERSAGGQLWIRCARSSQNPFRLENGTVLLPGDLTLVACDGTAWYEISTQYTPKSVALGTVAPGQVSEISETIKDARINGESNQPVFVSTETDGHLQWTEPTAVTGRAPGRFEISCRVKNSGEKPITIVAHYKIG